MQTDDKGILTVLGRAGTAVIADVFDLMGRTPPVLDNDLWPTLSPGQSFAGPAYTVEGRARSGPQEGDRRKLQAIDDMTPGVVAVFAGNDIRGACCFGDLLATAMRCRGVAGVVVDGGVRDLAFLRAMDLPMMVRYRTPAQAIGRWRVTAVQEPVRVRGALVDHVEICPGDLVVGDDDGVVVVSSSLAAEMANRAAQWGTKDQAARRDIAGGMKLLDALAKHGAL